MAYPPEVYRRALGAYLAAACENATRKTCICRCGGALHGISHVEFNEVEQELLKTVDAVSREHLFEIATTLVARRAQTEVRK